MTLKISATSLNLNGSIEWWGLLLSGNALGSRSPGRAIAQRSVREPVLGACVIHSSIVYGSIWPNLTTLGTEEAKTQHFISTFQGKRACVIGGGGFLGRHLVEKLLERSCQVTVFDLRCEYSDNRIKVVTGDLCDKQVCMGSKFSIFLVGQKKTRQHLD